MKKLLFILPALVLVVGCVDNEPEPGEGAGKYITVTADVPSTRGTPVTSVSQIADLGLFCSYTARDQWNETRYPDRAHNSRMVRSASNDVWNFDGEKIGWDASSAADNFTFFAYAPYATGSNGIAVTSAQDAPGIPKLSYTVPADVKNQPDLMVAVPKKDLHPTGHPVALQMKHALVAVGFRVSGTGEKITGIKITGIKASGELAMNGSNIAWSNLLDGTAPGGYSASIAFDAGQNYFTAGTARNLLTGDGYLMMIPQQLGAGAVITMEFDDNTTRDFSLNSFQWNAGERAIYNISLAGAGVIEVSPDALMLPTAAQAPAAEPLTVNCTYEDMEWTLTSADAWLKMSLVDYPGSAAATVSGTGSQTVYVFATTNGGANVRSANILLGAVADGNVACKVSQIGTTPPNNKPVSDRASCVGAFWRWNETGERVIQINGATGMWMVCVSEYGTGWDPVGGDGILFAAGGSLGATVGTADLSEYDSDAENFKVTDSRVKARLSASGTVGADGSIMFRMWPQKQFTDYVPDFNPAGIANPNPVPARYARVELWYNDMYDVQYLYLRQGEGADLLMPVVTPNRQQSKRFSPYNLTADNIGNDGKPLATRGGKFTDYPTKVGAIFQWGADGSYVRYAFNPFNQTPGITAWNMYFINSWDTSHETCPKGYRRPKDNVNYDYSNGASGIQSEMRHSLWVSPPTGDDEQDGNSMYGYYADGYYDRYHVDTGTGNAVGIVNENTPEVATIGRLFYNSGTLASLFFPTSGFRGSWGSGPYQSTGYTAYYWTSTTRSGGSSFQNQRESWILNMRDEGGPNAPEKKPHVRMLPVDRANGGSIRCVME